MQYSCIPKEEWDKTLEQLSLSFTIFATVKNEFGQDYELIRPEDIPGISYNKPKPATSLKSFFLPVSENVTTERSAGKKRVIIGVPNCDIEGLSLLDEIYLDNEYEDIFYRKRRENTILISSDCFGIQEHCHCMSYGIMPYSVRGADLAVINLDEKIILRIITRQGEDFVNIFPAIELLEDNKIIDKIEQKQRATEKLLETSNENLPDFKTTGVLVTRAEEDIWEKYSSQCVSCGACTTICPTCTCFLLIDKPGFEKVKQMDTCQYPGFGRVAGGEDVLFELRNRFRNRYMCKYSWKPGKFRSTACTGCGRCIEACIGKINKNELFRELSKQPVC